MRNIKDKEKINFHFYNKKDKFIWKNCDIKIVFSNPSIQAFNDDICIDDAKKIMYFYYTLTIYRKEVEYDDKTDKYKKYWKEINSISTYDFPTIQQLQYFLNHLLNEEIKLEDCRKITYYTNTNEGIQPSGKYGYEYSMESEGFAAEDFYQITRLLIKDEDNSYTDGELSPWGIPMYHDKDYESFSIYIGTVFGNNPFSSIGIRYPKLNRNDLQELFNCVNKFIEYTIECHNISCIENNKKSIESFKINNNFLYEMDKNNPEIIDSIYTKNTICDITVIDGDINTRTFTTIEYQKTNIIEIKKDSIVIQNGYIDKNNYHDFNKLEGKIEIPINTIIHLFNDLDATDETKKRLNYSKEEVIDDFLNIIDNEIKEEFKNYDTKFLYKKWNSAIANRCWLYREEHNLPILIKNNHHKNVELTLKEIIKEIKNKL